MEPLRSDPVFYGKRDEKKNISGFSGDYVDDIFRAGNKHFKRLSTVTSQKFTMAEDNQISMTLSGFHVDQKEDGFVNMNQRT